MSFTLKSIELNNIRAHEYFLFEPALEGITAISGDNGAGKSTIVDAFAWSLYGTRPSGVRNKNLIRDGVDPAEKPVSVKSHIIIGGIEYIVERKMVSARGTVECNVWGKVADGNEFTQVAGPGVSHVEKFIRNEIGMNEKGLLTSVLIQQKQVDQIVSATPRERGAVIEELTGISSITQAISKANENTRALQKAASIFHIGSSEEAKERVEKQDKVCQDIKAKEVSAIKTFKDSVSALNEDKELLKVEKVKVEKRVKLSQRLEGLKEQVVFLKKQAEDDIKYIMDYKKKYGTTIHVDTDKSKKSVAKKRTESYDLKSKYSSLSKELEVVKSDKDKCVILKGAFEGIKEAESELKKLENILDKLEKELEDNKYKKITLASELKQAKASHEHIDGENTNCPVCKSKIKDPELLKKEMEEDMAKLESQQKSTNVRIKELTVKISEIKDEINKVSISVEAIKEEVVLTNKEKEISEEIADIVSKGQLVNSELKVLEEEYDKALRVEADKNALASAKERSLTVNTTIADYDDKIAKTEKEIKELNALNDRSFGALTKRVEEAQVRVTKMSIAGKELQGRKKLELERLDDYIKNLKEVEASMEKYNEIAEQISVSSSASAMLSAFKADRIEHSIPTLEFFASDFLSKFTGGAFTNLTVDEKFNTFVTTSTGVVRPVAQLSGGELSSTAIALRLGIAMLVNSSEKNVLILDEVLVSMDEDRSRQIMETISSMTNSQVIFIAHNTDINSVADRTVLVTKK